MDDRLKFKLTPFGFEWGPVKIERHIENKGAVILGIETALGKFDMYVTPTGKVKFFVPQGQEITFVGSMRKKRCQGQ
jgi:hypothetical protein